MLCAKSSTVYALIDCNSFYASCELIRRPDLQGKCVCVGREKDIILAATYEAKYKGVTTGTAYRDAEKILGTAGYFISPDFAWYNYISAKLKNYLERYALSCEMFSVDEAFIDITGYAENQQGYEKIAEELIYKIHKNIGIPVSIGIASTKLRAKMFANIKKPRGCVVGLENLTLHELYKTMSIDQIPFVGKKTYHKLWLYAGIKTVLDYHNLSSDDIIYVSGKSGLKIRHEIHGYNAFFINHDTPQRSIYRTKSFHPHFTNDKNILRQYLSINIERAHQSLKNQGLVSSLLTVKLRDRNFITYKVKQQLEKPTDNRFLLTKIFMNLFDTVFDQSLEYRTTGVTFGLLVPATAEQYSLFENSNIRQSQARLTAIIHRLNNFYKKPVITQGLTNYTGFPNSPTNNNELSIDKITISVK